MSEMNSDQHAVEENRDVVARNVSFSYAHSESHPVRALDDISIDLVHGKHVALLGRNGSGKSTMARLIDVLETPDAGSIMVLGKDTMSEEDFWEIRKSCGMVFQNPDNQIVGTLVEEDVAFGPENLGIPSPEIRVLVDEALRYVGLSDYAKRQPSQLSGGQKQKLAIAGILAMMPKILILDESTSMLDPISRDEFLSVVDRLIKEKEMTVLHITHDMEEACLADYVYVLAKGKIALHGTPGEVFSHVEQIQGLGLVAPVYAELAYCVSDRIGVRINRETLFSRKTARAELIRILSMANWSEMNVPIEKQVASQLPEEKDAKVILEVNQLSFAYEKGKKSAISSLSFSVRKGEIFAVIGHSGSGKTTLISHLNGLLRPQEGDVFLTLDDGGRRLSTRVNSDVKEIRRHVGLLFQYPEYQLFEETVEKDIAFGPTKLGMSSEEISRRTHEAISLVGLDEEILARSPFELSGGQKRRVAFAGVLAMNPDVLVLDEPAAGLDPAGRKEIFEYALQLKKMGKTIILVSHNMNEAAKYADRLLVLSSGVAHGPMTPKELFEQEDYARSLGIAQVELVSCLKECSRIFPGIETCVFSVSEAADILIRAAYSRNVSEKGCGADD